MIRNNLRCKYSESGKRTTIPQNYDRLGIILNESKDKECWIVHWDGNKPSSITYIHKSFIEKIKQLDKEN